MTYHTRKNKTFLKQLFYALSVVIMGLLLWGVKNYFFFKPESDVITLGTFSQFKTDQILHKKKEHLFIVCDSSGLYALSDVCTHRGCMLLIKDNTFECPCHGAVFTRDGQPVSGPAEKSLDYYYIYKNKKNVLVVDVTQTVNNTFRYLE